jgi:hypothetical protein
MEIKLSKPQMFVLALLILISGLVLYYLYLKPHTDPFYNYNSNIEAFTTTEGATTTTGPTTTGPTTTGPTTTGPTTTGPTTTRPTTTLGATTTTTANIPTCAIVTTPPVSPAIMSRFFGIGFNIYPANISNQSAMPTNSPNTSNLYLIEHIPVQHTGTIGGMYSISADGLLTIKLRNDQDPTQWWSFTKLNDSKSDYYVLIPFSQANSAQKMALQYENGNLALRPFQTPGTESQKWIFSNAKVTRGIPVLNYNPLSLYTPEFDPYSTSNNITSSSLTQQNNQQISEVVNLIKTNIQQYLKTIGASQNVPQVSASSLGNKETPLNISLKLSGGNTASAFSNIDGTTTANDVLSLLDKYENIASGTNNLDPNTTLVNSSNLQTAMNNYTGCPKINIKDYTSNRVSSCNCKL